MPPPPAPNPAAAPLAAPDGIVAEPERPAPPPHPDPIVTGIVPGAGRVETVVAAPPAPPSQSPPATVRPGAGIQTPAKVHDVAPLYPPIARDARVQGVVIIEATIGVSGAVEQARVLRSVPLLDEAALAAVRQWRYTPTLLNGVPVAVVMTVTVQFQLR